MKKLIFSIVFGTIIGCTTNTTTKNEQSDSEIEEQGYICSECGKTFTHLGYTTDDCKCNKSEYPRQYFVCSVKCCKKLCDSRNELMNRYKN